MKRDLEDKNLCAFQYNEEIISQILSICDPIINFGITHFRYMKMYNDYRYLSLGTNLNYLKQYLLTIKEPGSVFGVSQIFKESFLVNQDEKTSYFIWPTDHAEKTNDPLSVLLLKYDVWNGFTVSKRGENYVETYSFATTMNNPISPNFYINNRDMFDYFTIYFKSRAAEFIKNIPLEHLSCFENKFEMEAKTESVQSTKTENLLKEMKLVNVLDDRAVNFTQRELECLVELANGYTMKEIAKKMEISPRTVECYLNSMKLKTGCFSKSQLLSLISEDELHLMKKIWSLKR